MANAAALCGHSPPLRPTCRHRLPLQRFPVRLHHSWPSGGSTTSLLGLRHRHAHTHAHELVGFRPHLVNRRRSARRNKLFFPLQCKVESIVEGEFGDKVLRSDVPVLVEFVADWCGPCRLVVPAVEWASQVMIFFFFFNMKKKKKKKKKKNLEGSQPIKSNQIASI